jgi:hypothetical protein
MQLLHEDDHLAGAQAAAIGDTEQNAHLEAAAASARRRSSQAAAHPHFLFPLRTDAPDPPTNQRQSGSALAEVRPGNHVSIGGFS